MAKLKICPFCKAHNDPASIECINCEADLTRVRVIDEQEEQKKAERANPVLAVPARYRTCECGAKNAANARKCSVCGEDISDVTPEEEVSADQSMYRLESMDAQCRVSIEKEMVIGREYSLKEYLGNKPFVSRKHAKLTLEADGLYIENLSNTNYTYVNNRRITQKTRLSDGDEIGLGGFVCEGQRQEQAAYFMVKY
jgi:hypothetical protein